MDNGLKDNLEKVGLNMSDTCIRKETKDVSQVELLEKVIDKLKEKNLEEISEILLYAKQVFDIREFTTNKKVIDRKKI